MRDQDKFAAVFRSARKKMGLTQVQVAERLSVTQGSVSKLEKGLYVPDIFLWLRFCQITQIPVRSCEWGYIDWLDQPQRVELAENQRVGRFELPRKYAHSQGQSVRSLSPLLAYSHERLTPRQTEKIFDSLDIDSDYFVDYRNQINVQFVYDYLDQLVTKTGLKKSDLDDITDYAISPSCHGSIFDRYSEAGSTEKLLQTYLDNISYYHCDFEYGLTKHGEQNTVYDLHLKPKEHMSQFQASSAVSEFLVQFQKSFLEKFLEKFSHKPKSIHNIEQSKAEIPSCTIRFQM